eukprot:jgi/Bigna1/78962/fgenesh1_pg.58_\
MCWYVIQGHNDNEEKGKEEKQHLVNNAFVAPSGKDLPEDLMRPLSTKKPWSYQRDWIARQISMLHGVWNVYDEMQTAVLEEAWEDKKGECQIGIGGMRYTVDFKDMEQINPMTKTRRRVKRQNEMSDGANAKMGWDGLTKNKKRKRRKLELPGTLKARLKKLSKWAISRQNLTIHKRIGQGAFGEVFLAEWKGNGLVALKTLRNTDKVALNAYVKEAQLITALKHRNIVEVKGLTTLEAPLGFVFEYAPDSLAARIRQGNSLTIVDVLRVARDVAEGLLYLHTRTPPIMHRDLKPENILISTKGHAMLCDFGISREQKATLVMTACGTPSYMPPEVFQDDIYTTKADVFSFAMLLYAMLAGHGPWGDAHYKSKNKFVIMKLVADEMRPPKPPPPPRNDSKVQQQAHRELFERLFSLVEACWKQNPEDRLDVARIIERLQALEGSYDSKMTQLRDMGFPRFQCQVTSPNYLKFTELKGLSFSHVFPLWCYITPDFLQKKEALIASKENIHRAAESLLQSAAKATPTSSSP